MDKEVDTDEIIKIQEDIFEVYWKDFRYLNPEGLGVQRVKRDKTKDEAATFQGFFNMWFREVYSGLKEFMYKGSLHGVKYIYEPSFNRRERTTWIVITIVSVCVCAVQITKLFSKWNSSPFVNVISSLPTPVWAVPFPSVVLCPHLHLKLSEAKFEELDESWFNTIVSICVCAVQITPLFSKWNSSPFVNVIDSLLTPVWAVPFPIVVMYLHLPLKLSEAKFEELDDLEEFYASLICPRMFKQRRATKDRLGPEINKRLEEFIIRASPKCSEVIKKCYWRPFNDSRVTTDCCDVLFKPVFTNYGLCFGFNELPLNGMTNKTIAWQKTYAEHPSPTSLKWNIDDGYPKVFPPDAMMKPHRAMASGEANGLGVELFLNTSEQQYACDGNSLGFNMLVSSPTDHVYTSTILRLPMDRMTTIEVSPITYKTDSDLRQLNPERRQCFFQNERQLEYFSVYTDSNCKHDQLIRESIRSCDCVQFNWPRKNLNESICSTEADFRCIDEVKDKVEEQLIYAYYADSEEQRKPRASATSCYPSCNDILYYSQVFYSDLRKEREADYLVNPNDGQITQINVHFYDDMFLGQHRHAQYDDYYFVGAVGGLLSLFLGFSIISVAELAYFVIVRPLYRVLMQTLLPAYLSKARA